MKVTYLVSFLKPYMRMCAISREFKKEESDLKVSKFSTEYSQFLILVSALPIKINTLKTW